MLTLYKYVHLQLLGHIDIDTREWTDGVLTYSARQVVKEPTSVQSWIICDGDIDPEWIESLNSVLDDNRLLTMPSGERIQFGPNVNFLFESHDLSCASPATISRMGMIFLRSLHTRIFHVCMHTYLRIWSYIYVCICKPVCIYIQAYIYVCKSVCTYRLTSYILINWINIHMYVHI